VSSKLELAASVESALQVRQAGSVWTAPAGEAGWPVSSLAVGLTARPGVSGVDSVEISRQVEGEDSR
jgi:hypothetical protein